MNYKIIPLNENLIDQFCVTVDAVAKENKNLVFLEEQTLDLTRAYTIETLRKNLPHFVALSDEQIIGWCDISSLHWRVFAHSGELGMGVLAHYRRQGIAEALIKTALEKAKQIGLTRIELTVFENNIPAINLYKKLDFSVEGLKRNAIKLNDTYINLICMAILI